MIKGVEKLVEIGQQVDTFVGQHPMLMSLFHPVKFDYADAERQAYQDLIDIANEVIYEGFMAFEDLKEELRTRNFPKK